MRHHDLAYEELHTYTALLGGKMSDDRSCWRLSPVCRYPASNFHLGRCRSRWQLHHRGVLVEIRKSRPLWHEKIQQKGFETLGYGYAYSSILETITFVESKVLSSCVSPEISRVPNHHSDLDSKIPPKPHPIGSPWCRKRSCERLSVPYPVEVPTTEPDCFGFRAPLGREPGPPGGISSSTPKIGEARRMLMHSMPARDKRQFIILLSGCSKLHWV